MDASRVGTPVIIVIDGSDSDDEDGAIEATNGTATAVLTLPARVPGAPQRGPYVPLRAGGLGRFVPARWPYDVVNLRDHFNPSAIQLRANRHFGMCGCLQRCRHEVCMNARLGIFCDRNCCSFGGNCGNGLRQPPRLRLLQNTATGSYLVEACERVESGVVLGEYFGLWTLEPRDSSSTRRGGYRLAMQAQVHENRHMRVCIDAEMFGGLMRFINHSCNPTAYFHEVSNGRRHTVVAVTDRVISRGEEVTVGYGDNLWFVCRCGERMCRHRHLDM